MGWETRQRGGCYYTRSRKVGGRVVREYVGGGLAGLRAAEQDQQERQRRAADAAAWRAERTRLAAAEARLVDAYQATDRLVSAALTAAGYHQHHRGEWRRTRGARTTPHITQT